MPQWDTCLIVDGNYREVWFVPSGTHLSNEQLPISFLPGFEPWCQWDTCLTVNGNYREVWFVPSGTHLASGEQCQNELLSTTVFVLFLNSFVHGNTIRGFH